MSSRCGEDVLQSSSRLHPPLETDKRARYPSSTNGDGGHDVDSSTELWDDGEDESHCSHCSTSLHNQYTASLKSKIKEQQQTLAELKSTVKALEVSNLQQFDLKRDVAQQEQALAEKSSEIGRLEGLVEEYDALAQQTDDLKLLLQLKDEEIKMLNKDVTRLSERVSDYNEIEAHNTDLQSELFARDREVMTLKHSEERLRSTYLELISKNSQLEVKLLEQDGRHEDGKVKFEKSIVKLTNRLIEQRKKSEQLEQDNARSVRDCRLAVRLLQCSSPASNEHATQLHQNNKLTFLFNGANKPISNTDTKTQRKDLRAIKQNSFEDESGDSSPASQPTQPTNTEQKAMNKTVSSSSSCLESLHCISRQSGQYQHNRQTGASCVECAKKESVSVLKDLLQGKKDAIHVLRVELGKRDKEITLLRKKLTQNISESLNTKHMEPGERIENLETRVTYLSDENFNLKYQLEICRKMLDKLSGAAPSPS